MIILDFSSTMIASLHAHVGLHNIRVVEEDLLRHMILNSVRAIKTRFKRDGELIVACDSGSWRKNVYPYYKANRKKAKEESGLDWRQIFECFTRMRTDLREFFPYRVIEVSGAEADDVVGTLVFEFGNETPMSIGEDIVIVSPDKDFAQLHRFGNVKQFDPIKKKFITHADPEAYLREHVIRGDPGDGVPNIMSDDDTFVTPGKRQKTMTKGRFEAFMAGIPDEFKRGHERNRVLIDLRETPLEIKQQVLASYVSQAGKKGGKIFEYMMAHSLRGLMENIQDFK